MRGILVITEQHRAQSFAETRNGRDNFVNSRSPFELLKLTFVNFHDSDIHHGKGWEALVSFTELNILESRHAKASPPMCSASSIIAANGDSELNRACKPDDYDTEQTPEPEHVHRAVLKAAQEPVHAQASTAVDGSGLELGIET